MKNRYLSVILLSAFFLSLSLTTHKKKSLSVDLLVTDSLLPILPPMPYDYDLHAPEYILTAGTGWEPLDFTAINSKITPDGATLGRVLFYDKLLSASNELACASCHKQAHSFADNKQFSEGIGGAMTTRNSPNLNDVGWTVGFGNFGSLFWDCRASSLDSMVLMPIVHQGELGKDLEYLVTKLSNTNYYPELFFSAYGSSEITPQRIGNAIAQFVRSMTTFNTYYDKVKSEEAGFNSPQRNGSLTFQANCSNCHSLTNFGTFSPRNTGLDSITIDPGVSSWTGNATEAGMFKSPSLRNIALTAPYMHDGRFETLEEVIDFYSDHIQPHPNSSFNYYAGPDFTGFHYTDQQKLDLKHFLLTLTDSSFITDIRFSDPFTTVLAAHETGLEHGIVIAPNPFSETTTVTFKTPFQSNTTMQLLYINGRLLKTYQINGIGAIEIHKTDLPNKGIYLLKFQNEEKKWVKKLVVH